MLTLLLLLIPISLVDTASGLPFFIVPLIVLLGSDAPYFGSACYMTGIFLSYTAMGFVAVFGLDQLFDLINQQFHRVLTDPHTIELILQIIIGCALVVVGNRAKTPRDRTIDTEVSSLSPGRALALGGGLTITGMPAAVPYLAAIDQILKADIGSLQMANALVFYNLVFLAPFILLVALRFVFPNQALAILGKVNTIFTTWGGWVIGISLILLGVILVVDGIGFFFGKPLIPVGT